jgi:predicted TIM-barrel fold metal-dependent hydrolase
MIDTHQHLAFPDKFDYPWIAELPQLQQTLALEAYREAIQRSAVAGSVFVEVDVACYHSAAEAQYVCQLAEDPSNGIQGVVAAARPEAGDFVAQLDALAHPAIKGIRRVLHTQDDALSEQPLFRHNVNELSLRGWSFDLCILQRQLGIGIDLVRDCPEVHFIVDHAGVPDIAGNDAPHGEGFKEWQQAMRALSAEPNCSVKLSGLPLYASDEQRTVEGLWPYVTTLLETFGWQRIVWGGDWPVCTLAHPLSQWIELTHQLLKRAGLDRFEKGAILTTNACKIYKLEL